MYVHIIVFYVYVYLHIGPTNCLFVRTGHKTQINTLSLPGIFGLASRASAESAGSVPLVTTGKSNSYLEHELCLKTV